jgi:tRNA A-37 threonylcarbamoyl transferase component Bud32
MGQQASGGGDASDASAGVPQAGEVVGGKFVVERVLGIGGMGVVVAAHHTHLDQTVAIKFLRRDAAKDEGSVNRFLREARAVSALQSEHVVRVMDAGRLDDGLPYLVMEYLNGLDLDQVLGQRGQLPLEEAVEYLLQSMEAVADAHAAGIVHRDLKPSNLFLTTRSDGSPFVKVLDFGISKALDTTGNKQVSLTATSMTLGSPLYMSPEQVRSSKSVDARTDVWALGVIAYELLAGVQPFEAETVTGLCAKIVADEPEPLRTIRPDVPAAFEAVVLRCLEKNAGARYQSVVELAVALRPFASADGRSSVARIARGGGGGRATPTLMSALDRNSPVDPRAAQVRGSTPGARVGTPRGIPASTPTAAVPSDPDVGYAETVASWQATGDRRGKTAKTATAAAIALVGIAVCLVVATKWPRATTLGPATAVSAASVIDLPGLRAAAQATGAPAAPAAVPSTPTGAPASTESPSPGAAPSSMNTPVSAPSSGAARPELETPAAPSGARASSPLRHLALRPPGGAPSAKTTEDLLLDRK